MRGGVGKLGLRRRNWYEILIICIGTGLGGLASGNLLAIDIISSTVALVFAVDDNVARSTPAKQEWLITLP